MVVLGEHREAVQHQHPQSVRIPTTIFSENGVAVASMCAVLDKYRPVAANEGGVTGKVDISLKWVLRVTYG